jgi:hypothetical protein
LQKAIRLRPGNRNHRAVAKNARHRISLRHRM